MKPLIKLLFLTMLFLPFSAAANDELSVETEAMEIADRLRCLVCSDENIETARDETANDMRFFIRRHLAEGKTQDLIVHLLLAQYGDMISLEDTPLPNSKNEELFIAASFICTFIALGFYLFKRSRHFSA